MIPGQILDRYNEMLRPFPPVCQPVPGTHPSHLRWMLRIIPSITDEAKANRWLGFIQGVLIERGFTTVTAERDFTRSHFAAQKG